MVAVCGCYSCCSSLTAVGGLGFGVISSVVIYANVIEAASGPGIVGILDPTEDSQFFVLSGGMCESVCVCVCIQLPKHDGKWLLS